MQHINYLLFSWLFSNLFILTGFLVVFLLTLHLCKPVEKILPENIDSICLVGPYLLKGIIDTMNIDMNFVVIRGLASSGECNLWFWNIQVKL